MPCERRRSLPVPAIKAVGLDEVKGFNVLVGGKNGSGGYTVASSLDVFVRPDEAAALGARPMARLIQTDIKRVLAYSTLSQLGYMFAALGVGAWTAAIFSKWGAVQVPPSEYWYIPPHTGSRRAASARSVAIPGTLGVRVGVMLGLEPPRPGWTRRWPRRPCGPGPARCRGRAGV